MSERFWVLTDVGDPLGSIGCGYRVVEVIDLGNGSVRIQSPLSPDEVSVNFPKVTWEDHIPHIPATSGQTLNDVTRQLRAFKRKGEK